MVLGTDIGEASGSNGNDLREAAPDLGWRGTQQRTDPSHLTNSFRAVAKSTRNILAQHGKWSRLGGPVVTPAKIAIGASSTCRTAVDLLPPFRPRRIESTQATGNCFRYLGTTPKASSKRRA